jgi:hypothetical protein
MRISLNRSPQIVDAHLASFGLGPVLLNSTTAITTTTTTFWARPV